MYMCITYTLLGRLCPLKSYWNLCLYRFRDIASYLSIVAEFNIYHLHLAPLFGMTPVEFCGDLWHQKMFS